MLVAAQIEKSHKHSLKIFTFYFSISNASFVDSRCYSSLSGAYMLLLWCVKKFFIEALDWCLVK